MDHKHLIGKITLFALRVSLGAMFLYAGMTKLLDPTWSAAGYLLGAKSFTGFYQWLAQPGILPVVNFLNAWGLTLLGLALILGIGVRLASDLGAILMLLYYGALSFPFPSATAFIIDDHIIYAIVLLYLAAVGAGQVWGLEEWCMHTSFCKRHRIIHYLLA
ncbi:DoxX family membrane protein [Patescibacteria group bacterium]|nr:DoxX family membrane protein [Patescibacteria group bacterium]